MKFSVDWIDGGLNRAAEERATLCELGIYVDGQNACRFIDYVANEETEALIVPAVHLAEGLAIDWWTIFGGRDRDHRIMRYRTGFALPDLYLRTDGATFEVTSKVFVSKNPHLGFRFNGKETLPRINAEAEMSGFIGAIVARLAGKRVRNSAVAARWSRVVESRNDPDEHAFCEAAGALGLDPYAISDDDARFIEDSNTMFSGESLVEFLAGIGKEERSPSTLERVRQLEARPAEKAGVPELSGVVSQIAPLIRRGQNDRPWEVGYRAAAAFRQALGMTSSDRFVSHVGLAKKLGAVRFEAAKLFDGVRALISCSDGDTRIHLHDHSGERAAMSSSFSLARAVGDAVCFPGTPRSVVNGLHHADRQATGRAFAAELLAPVQRVLEMWDDVGDVGTIANEFGVSSFVITNQIENRGRIQHAQA